MHILHICQPACRYTSHDCLPACPRYTNTSAVISRISFIDGELGILRYRGYPIEQLAEKSNFMEVAYLVLFGSLPTQTQFATFNDAVMRHTALPEQVRTG